MLFFKLIKYQIWHSERYLPRLWHQGWTPLGYCLTVFYRWHYMIIVDSYVISWRSPVAEKYHKGILLACCRSFRLAHRFFILCDNVIIMLYYILALSLLGRWYQNVDIYIQLCTDWCHLLGGDGTRM